MSIFSERLSELRKDRGIQQKDLAAILNIELQNLSNYERGLYEPDFEIVVTLARFYGVTLDYLFGLIDTEIALDRSDILMLPKNYPAELKETVLQYALFILTARESEKMSITT